VDIAVGCSYKYLCGGPGAPAWAYVGKDLHTQIEQPIQGWWGTKNMFLMEPGYEAEQDLRRFLTGTPSVVGMQAMIDPVELIAEAGMSAIREKSLLLTEFVIAYSDEFLAPLGVSVATPRDPARRGGHVTLSHPLMREVNAQLWKEDIIPDYRDPGGLRIGLSPLSTSFHEVFLGMEKVKETLLSLR
jgi:kynureninase